MAYSSMQFCGDKFQAYVDQNGQYVQGNLVCGDTRMTLGPQHIRALAAALDRFEAIAALKAEWVTICSAMNHGTWPGSEAAALTEIERIKGEIAANGGAV